MRKKTVNRLLLISVVTVVAAAGLGGAYFVRRSMLDTRAMSARKLGMDEAVRDKDYQKSLNDLGNYLGRFQNRPEHAEPQYGQALFYYALSRQMVEQPNLGHLQTAVALWKRYLGEFAGKDGQLDSQAREHLLDAQLNLQWWPEAIDTAREILRDGKKNQKALSTQALYLESVHKYSEASDAVNNWIGAYPHDLEAHFLKLRLIIQQDPDRQVVNVVKYADDLLALDPNDPCYQILASIAATHRFDAEDKVAAETRLTRSIDLAQKAALPVLTDINLVRNVVRQIDQLWLYSIYLEKEKDFGLAGKALAFARAAAEAHPANAEFRFVYAQRLFQAGAYDQLYKELENITVDGRNIDNRLLVVKAAALYKLGKDKEARELLDAAIQRKGTDAEFNALCDAAGYAFIAPQKEQVAFKPLRTAIEKPGATIEELNKALKAFKNDPQTEQSAALADLEAIERDSHAGAADYLAKANAYLVARARFWQAKINECYLRYRNSFIVLWLADASTNADDPDRARVLCDLAIQENPGWAQAYVRKAQLGFFKQHDGRMALSNCAIAHALLPDDPDIAAFYTLVSVSVILPDQSAEVTSALARVKDLQSRFVGHVPPEVQQQIVIQLSRLGKNAEAMAFLEAVGGSADQSPDSAAGVAWMKARLLARSGKIPEALEAYEKLADEFPSVDVINEAAQFAGNLGQKDKVATLVAKLSKINAPRGAGDVIWANYFANHGSPQEAAKSATAAIAANPSNPAAWRSLLAFCLKVGKVGDFDGFAVFKTSLEGARRAVPDDPAITFLVKLQDMPGNANDGRGLSVLQELSDDLFVRPLFVAHLEIPYSDASAKAVRACLDAIVDNQVEVDKLNNPGPAEISKIQDKLIARVQGVASESPDAFAVHNFLVAFYGLTNKFPQCVGTAQSVMKAFPGNAPLVAQGAIRVLAASGHWEECLEVAKEWRRQASLNPLQADVAIAECYLSLRKPTEALQIIAPHINEITNGTQKPEDNEPLWVCYIRALLNSGQTLAATDRVSPLLSNQRWRLIWMQCLASLPDGQAAATGLSRLESRVPADANEERINLAIVWNIVATRTENVAHRKNAFALLDAMNSGASKPFLENFGQRAVAPSQENAPDATLWARWIIARNVPESARSSLSPLLKTPAGRAIWVKLTDDIADATIALVWLEDARAVLLKLTDPPAVLDHPKLQLADAYRAVAERRGVPPLLKQASLKTASDLLDSMSPEKKKTEVIRGRLALVYEDQGNYSAAAKIYADLIEEKPDDATLLNNLANLLAKMKQTGEVQTAINLIGHAIQLAPKEPNLYDTQATIYAVLAKDYPNALLSIKNAIDRAPGDINWKVSRIWILYLNNQKELARAEFAKLSRDQLATDLNPDSQERLSEIGFKY